MKRTPFEEPASAIHRVIETACQELPNVTPICAWNFVPHVTEFFSDFFLHPNDLGLSIYADNLYRAIQEKL